jgi:hypothetical protein
MIYILKWRKYMIYIVQTWFSVLAKHVVSTGYIPFNCLWTNQVRRCPLFVFYLTEEVRPTHGDSKAEVDFWKRGCSRTGVAKQGVWNWHTILNDPELSFILCYFSNFDLLKLFIWFHFVVFMRLPNLVFLLNFQNLSSP